MRLPSRMLPAALVAAGLSGFASAETLTAVPGQPLQALLDRARDGDVVELAPGDYNGSIRIDRPLALTGRPGAVLDGGGSGNVVTVTAPDVTVRGVTIRGSGRDLQAMNSGVFLQKTAERATIENNRLVGNLFGVYVHGATGSRVANNLIEGLRGHRLSEAGNGVSLWNAPEVTIADNTFRYGRDGIFTISSRKDRFVGNRFEQVRFAVHYMYTNDSEVSGNVSIGNHVGYAIMYSNRLIIRDNISDRDRDHGLLFNYANYAEIDGNRVTGGTIGYGVRRERRGAGRRARHDPGHEARAELAKRPGEVRVHLQHEPQPVPEQLVRTLRHRRSFHGRIRRQRDHRKRLRRQSEPGQICRYAQPRLVQGRPRQLLERQSRLRSRR
ncbi:parallel beta-helix repeat protein [Bradyrhizobium diazoefficiens]